MIGSSAGEAGQAGRGQTGAGGTGRAGRGQTGAGGTGQGGWRRRYLPPQHGAWAMLLVPFLAGVAVVGPGWAQVPLLAAWVAGYLLSYFGLQAIKTRRTDRVRRQLLVYSCLAVPPAALVVAAEPRVLLIAPAYAGLLAVNAWYAWRRRERALLNDVASVVQSCLVLFVVAVLGGAGPARVAVAFALVLAYFTGTVFYVKTMIRERGSVPYRRASVAYHLAVLAAVGWLGTPVAALFAALAVRAWVLPGRALAAKHVGMMEIGFSTALVLVIVFRPG